MEKLKNIRGIFFELGGTLIYPPSGSWMFSELAYRYFPKDRLSEPQIKSVMSEASRKLDENHLLQSIDEEYAQFYEYYRTVSAAMPELGLTDEDLRKATEDKVYNKADNYRLFDASIETLQAVHGKYKLGIISDTWPSIVPLLEYLDILKYFDCITFSFELGTFKPDRRMYEDALSKMGLPPESTVFIDDSARNLEGAKVAGINPVLIRAMPGIEPVEGILDIEKISGLLELLDM